MAFDPKKYLIRVQGNREYLPVSARLLWFRQDHPDWSIVTTPVEINLDKQYAIFSASIMNAEGKIVATGTKMENVKGFGDYIEKAETGSVGRALAMCGYGTQFAPELEEGGAGGRYADAPLGPQSAPMNRFASGRPNGAGNGFANRPGPMRQNPAPMNGNNGGGTSPHGANGATHPHPPVMEEENPFDSGAVAASTAPAPVAPRNNPLERTPVSPSSLLPRPNPPAAKTTESTPTPRVVRVREPEPDYSDPGGADEPDSPDDPFADDFAPAAAPVTPASRPANPSGEGPIMPLTPTKTNPMANNARCTVTGCTSVLTPSQLTFAQQKFGRAICILHQRDPAVVGNTGGGSRTL